MIYFSDLKLVYCKITVKFLQITLGEKIHSKGLPENCSNCLNNGVPLVIAYGAAGYFEENGTKFWSEWNCDKMTEFVITPEFNKISEQQHMQY